MKKFFLSLMALVGATAAMADSYPYLTFETTDGAKASVPVASLTVTFSGGTLMAGDKTFTISNLSKMYFSATDESTVTAIEAVNQGKMATEGATEAYDLNGRRIAEGQVHKGARIVRTKDNTYKIVVR